MILMSEVANFFVGYFLFVLAFIIALAIFLFSLYVSVVIYSWCEDRVDDIRWKIKKIKEEKKKKEVAQLVEMHK